MISLTIPCAREELADVAAGDSVLLSGTLHSARDAAHARFAETIAAGGQLPFDMRDQVIYFVGPTPARPGRAIGSAGPTTASRMDPYSPLLIERGLAGMIGKGRRSPEVKASMLEHGCVYFGAIEGTAALLARCVTHSETIAYEDLGSEAVRRMQVTDFPVMVVNDLAGGDLYEQGPAQWRRTR
ncbi:MAG: fumarate hydratase C-terminal domain-containing protein [Solirubrobacterales bacterium]|nr:fumarate hydratase C-terminal domain-containing protein [Solirubrobacterales bacterium]